ncbi:MAG: AAA family ATPase [Alphaproteobacteria bacterium]|nr:AAA family ATPase [Alphaproteobacteria bacterium]
MSVTNLKTKDAHGGGAAALQNMEMLDGLVVKSINREEHLPGIVGFSGPSGFGKSTAAAFVAARRQAAYIECRSVWTKKAFLENLARLLGIAPRKTINELLEQATEELAMTQRPLLIDEFDHAIDQNLIELVRDIYELAKSPIIIIGEERLQMKLKKWERFDGRVFTWAQALPADMADARALNAHYKPGLLVEDDLLEEVVNVSRGSVRRIVTNLNEIAIFARAEGVKKIGKAQWAGQPLYTGKPLPMREW